MSSGISPDVQAALDTWRECGADRRNPVHFFHIEALARRAAHHSGQARRLLDDKLAKLLDAYRAELDQAASRSNPADGVVAVDTNRPTPGSLTEGPLTELLAYIARQAAADGDTAAARRRAAYPEVPVIDDFRETWSKVSTNRQLRQSQALVPDNAGPLNSNHLVHRSLSLMRELSPGYLRHFLSYVDALSWMEQLNGGGAAAGKEAVRAGSAKKSARVKAR